MHSMRLASSFALLALLMAVGTTTAQPAKAQPPATNASSAGVEWKLSVTTPKGNVEGALDLGVNAAGSKVWGEFHVTMADGKTKVNGFVKGTLNTTTDVLDVTLYTLKGEKTAEGKIDLSKNRGSYTGGKGKITFVATKKEFDWTLSK